MAETNDRDGSYYSTRSVDRTWDCVVIGSGMGGMTTAATLAKLGQRVLVLEQHYVPGGFTHTFKRKRWVWDVGVHAVGEVTQQALLGRVLQRLTDGRLEWTTLGSVYDEFYFPDLRIDFADSRDRFAENVIRAFPQQRTALAGYLDAVRDVASAMKTYYLSRLLPPALGPIADHTIARRAGHYLRQHTRTALDQFSSDERFKSVLSAQWGYYGSPPSRSSFGIHGLVARHFFHGGYYPVGGAERIAETLLGTVAESGGWTRIRTPVDKIVIEGGRATGVRLSSGETVRARSVVSAAGALTTVNKLLPGSEQSKPWARAISALGPSPCHLCLYLGFKGDIREDGATAANKWFYETWDSRAETWHIDRDDAVAPVLYCSFPSLKDPRHEPGPELLHTGEVVTFVPYEFFAQWKDERWRRRGQDYETFKQSIADRMLQQFFKHMPGLRSKLAFSEMSTPISTEHFTRSHEGSIYGLEPTPARYANQWLRPLTPVRDLYLSGSDIASVGVMGAMLGGLLAACAVEPIASIRYLKSAASR